MKILIFILSISLAFELGESFSKYGRTCKDIGCSSNEMCVMATDPCSWNSGDQCGSYPTCRKVSNDGPTCARYTCPPTKICRLDGDTPKCVDDINAHTPDNPKSHNSVATYNENSVGSDQNNYGNQPAYPVLPGQTTPRPAIRRPGGGSNSGGYEGGSRGSGYPGQSQGSGYSGQGGGYPRQGGGYPGQGGYSNQGGYGQPGGYQQPGQGGYQYQGGYAQPGYNQGGGYAQPGYNQGGYAQNNNRYGQKPSSGSNPILDSVTGTLKTWGLFCFLIKYLSAQLYGY